MYSRCLINSGFFFSIFLAGAENKLHWHEQQTKLCFLPRCKAKQANNHWDADHLPATKNRNFQQVALCHRTKTKYRLVDASPLHTNGILINYFFTALLKSSALLDRTACILNWCSVYLISQLGGAFLPQAKRWRHVGQHLIHVIVMDTTTGGAREPSNGEEERGGGNRGCSRLRGGGMWRHRWGKGWGGG